MSLRGENVFMQALRPLGLGLRHFAMETCLDIAFQLCNTNEIISRNKNNHFPVYYLCYTFQLKIVFGNPGSHQLTIY